MTPSTYDLRLEWRKTPDSGPSLGMGRYVLSGVTFARAIERAELEARRSRTCVFYIVSDFKGRDVTTTRGRGE